MWSFEPAGGRSSRGPLLESGAPRLTDRRSERFREATANGSANHPPSAKRVGAWWPTFRPWSETHLDVLLEAQGWNSEFHRHRQARLACVSVGPWSANLDRLPAEGAQAVDRAGVFGHPTAKGSRSRGCDGALRFYPSGGPRHRPTHNAKPRPGCGLPRRGFAAQAALGRGRAPRAGRGKGELSRPVPC
jgi:hypothetical protein